MNPLRVRMAFFAVRPAIDIQIFARTTRHSRDVHAKNGNILLRNIVESLYRSITGWECGK